jgi:hypothetical protein
VNTCEHCGIPPDAGFFDDSNVRPAPDPGEQVVLACHQLHRNDCGVLMYFSQFTDRFASDTRRVQTPGYVWEVRRDGQPLSPYNRLEHIVNAWGIGGFPLHLRLEGGSRLELVISNLNVHPGDARYLEIVGGRILGRYWYNPLFGDHRDPS